MHVTSVVQVATQSFGAAKGGIRTFKQPVEIGLVDVKWQTLQHSGALGDLYVLKSDNTKPSTCLDVQGCRRGFPVAAAPLARSIRVIVIIAMVAICAMGKSTPLSDKQPCAGSAVTC